MFETIKYIREWGIDGGARGFDKSYQLVKKLFLRQMEECKRHIKLMNHPRTVNNFVMVERNRDVNKL
jgi:hypothetical protein